MESKNKKLIIFDFDGVLVNTIDFCFTELKIFNNDLTLEKFKSFAHGNFHDSLDKNKTKNSFVVPGNWQEIYDKNIKEFTINDVFDNTIKVLSKNNYLVIVSSSWNESINKFLDKENIKKYFTDILGADTHKSKIVKIKLVLKKYKIEAQNAVFITDSLGDILEGNECGVYSIAVTWGIHDKKTLEKGKPSIIIDDPRDLLKTIQFVLK